MPAAAVLRDRWTERAVDAARELLAPEGPALDLAALRITVACVLSFSTSIASAPQWAALPPAARTTPLGVGWLALHLPIDPDTVSAARVVFHLACGLGAVGLFTRASWMLVTVTAFFLLLVPQLGGAVFHDHHLLWLAVILAASPSGDALSIDAWLARRGGTPRPDRSRTHGLAVRLAWVVIGLVFFFPGVHKLAEQGLGWALSDNLRNQMWWKWTQDPSLLPALRIDRHPWALHTLGLLTIAFELSFLPLVLAPRTRAIAVIAACLFHAGTQYFMGIEFSVLWATYPMFVPWSALLDRVRHARGHRGPTPALHARREGSLPSEPGVRALVAAAIPLLAGIVIFGAMGAMQAYPFACYPTFQWAPPDHMPALELVAIDDAGREHTIERASFQEPGPRGWAMSWRLAGVYGRFDRDAFVAWLTDRASAPALHDALEGAHAIRVSRVEIDVDPDAAHEVVSRRVLTTIRREGAAWDVEP